MRLSTPLAFAVMALLSCAPPTSRSLVRPGHGSDGGDGGDGGNGGNGDKGDKGDKGSPVDAAAGGDVPGPKDGGAVDTQASEDAEEPPQTEEDALPGEDGAPSIEPDADLPADTDLPEPDTAPASSPDTNPPSPDANPPSPDTLPSSPDVTPTLDTAPTDRLLTGSALKLEFASVTPDKATYAIDNLPGTRWLVQGTPSWPQEIVLDLGKTETVTGLQYLETWSTVKGYEVYVSDDTAAFGSPVATGVIPGGDLHDLPVPAVAGRYVRFRMLGSNNNGSYCYISELRVYVR
jgi:hypothetical protein